MTTHNSREWEGRFNQAFITDFGLGITGWNTTNGPEINDIKEFIHQELQKARESERERINQFFAVKADYDTDNDCVILTDKVYHQAFFPDGCGSDGQDGRNRCEDCYKYRTKFGQNVLAKLEPVQSELDQPISQSHQEAGVDHALKVSKAIQQH